MRFFEIKKKNFVSDISWGTVYPRFVYTLQNLTFTKQLDYELEITIAHGNQERMI